MKKSMRFSAYFITVIFIFLGFLLKSCSKAEEHQETESVPIHILSSDGFIRNWLILGMFPNPEDKLNSADGGYQTDFLQSIGGETKAILDYSTTIDYEDEGGNEGTARTYPIQTAPSGIFNFNALFKNVDYKVAYAFCYIQSEIDQQAVCYFGSNDDAKVWVNGELVHQYPGSRSCSPRQDKFTFRLKEGLNPILIKVCERWGDWAFVTEVFTKELLAQMNQRPLIRAIHDIQDLDIRQNLTYGDVFSLQDHVFPEIQWINPGHVEKLLGEFPITVEWYDEKMEKVEKPSRTGTYLALVEGINPDGIYIRKAKRFYCTDQEIKDNHESENATRANWEPVPRIFESTKNNPILKAMSTGPAEAFELSYLAQNKGTVDKENLQPGKQARSFERSLLRRQSMLYWLDIPKGYGETDKRWPVIIFLHGSGLQGQDLSSVNAPIPPPVEVIRNEFPFIVVTPLIPAEYNAWPQDLLADLIDEIVTVYEADADRIYLTGVSLGGRGTWNFAIAYPDRVAAIVPVCGTYGHPEDICKIKNVPVWAFHGENDQVIPFEPVKRMVDQLKDCGGNVKFTAYPNEGHNIGDLTYANKELYEWLLEQRITR
jgi:predicted peptidase